MLVRHAVSRTFREHCELASHAENKRLTVIKAPAGFGKTSLALTWLNRLRAGGARVAWLLLDADDDEP